MESRHSKRAAVSMLARPYSDVLLPTLQHTTLQYQWAGRNENKLHLSARYLAAHSAVRATCAQWTAAPSAEPPPAMVPRS